jgi:hypothetical protein
MGRTVTRPGVPEAAMTAGDSYLDLVTAQKEATDHAA